MPFPLSPQSIDAIADIISGGGGHDTTPPIGIYRSGPKIEKFMRANVAFTVNGSRVPSLVQCLINLNNGFEADQALPRIIEAADPRDFIHEPERHIAVLDHLNRALRFDGTGFSSRAGGCATCRGGLQECPVWRSLPELSEVIDFDTVSRDLDRTLASSQTDPEDAVTAACSTVRRVPVDPHRAGVTAPCQEGRTGALQCREAAAWSDSRSDIDPLIANDVRQIARPSHGHRWGRGSSHPWRGRPRPREGLCPH